MGAKAEEGADAPVKTDLGWLREMDLSKCHIEEWYQVITGFTDNDGPGLLHNPAPKIAGHTADERAARLFGNQQIRYRTHEGASYEIRPITVLVDQRGYGYPISAKSVSQLIDDKQVLQETRKEALERLSDDEKHLLGLNAE